MPGDVPRIDDRRIGQPYRQTWMGMVDPARAMRLSGPVGAGFNMVGRLDMETGETDAWYGSDDDTFQEPQFVPTGAGELDGYVLSVIEKHAENRSDVGVFRAGAHGRRAGGGDPPAPAAARRGARVLDARQGLNPASGTWRWPASASREARGRSGP